MFAAVATGAALSWLWLLVMLLTLRLFSLDPAILQASISIAIYLSFGRAAGRGAALDYEFGAGVA